MKQKFDPQFRRICCGLIPGLNIIFPLFLGMVLYDNEF